jgi:hypothetical protein
VKEKIIIIIIKARRSKTPKGTSYLVNDLMRNWKISPFFTLTPRLIIAGGFTNAAVDEECFD